MRSGPISWSKNQRAQLPSSSSPSPFLRFLPSSTSPTPRLSLTNSLHRLGLYIIPRTNHSLDCHWFSSKAFPRSFLLVFGGTESSMGVSSETKLLQNLILYAASAALSCLVLFAGLRHLDPNREASKKALQHKKEIAKRLGRPFVQTNPYEVPFSLSFSNEEK